MESELEVDDSTAEHEPENETEKSHVEVLAEVRSEVRCLLKDPLLADLPPDVTPEEVSSQLALLQGRALTVQLHTYDSQIIRKWFVYTERFCMVAVD